MTKTYAHMLAAGLWVASIVLMVVQSVNSDADHLGQWAILIGLMACVPTGWSLLVAERMRMEDLAKVMANELCRYRQEEASSGVRRIP